MSILGNLGLGVAGSLPSQDLQNLTYKQTALNNMTAQAYAQQLAAASQMAPYAQQNTYNRPLIVVNVAHEKLHTQIMELVKQLPMSIAAQIEHCGYYGKDQDEAARFLIIFNNDRTLTFYDVDNFPSNEHIGRIALECP